ncbi:hypothetical protein ACOBQJ_15675 [Pelotomaculum propionicicum]|uniref:hypothetical protein n=1 Tax=Pelotomaculum propionicicum TaxID=258475 RepID=UPI003B75EAA3
MVVSAENSKVIVVTGDVTADWNIARLRMSRDTIGQAWNADDTARVCKGRKIKSRGRHYEI